ncbi:MAG TPA: holo-ACP synthase [Fimbriimonadaceae bacterium]|nr:holo-ACP synthase [Fimbriimonadaceae bacterium]
MIIGVGTDIVSLERIRRAAMNARFVERILTRREREEFTSIAEIAGRWAAKEAIAKALSSRTLGWQEVEILRGSQGEPLVSVQLPPGQHLHLSISHERENAVAFAVLEQRQPADIS